MLLKSLFTFAVAGLAATSFASANTGGGPLPHAQVSAVLAVPGSTVQVWVCNRDNHSVSLVDVSTGSVLAEIKVGINPRSLTLSADGTLLFVANQRGNIPLRANAVYGFPPNAEPGTITVINTQTLAVQTTINGVGVEPYGVLVSPSGKYFAVSGFRSGTVKLYDTVTFLELASHQYMNNLSFIPAPFDIADADENRDGIADLGEPRGFSIHGDNTKIYVTHNRSPYISVLDVSLNGSGVPTGIALGAKIDINDYPFNVNFNPTPVQTLASQGLPRFMEDIALSPDGTRALVPHLLHNINHDVNHSFGPGLAGDFANRVYPALTVLDTAANSYNGLGDNSNRLHHELSDPLEPAGYAAFGEAHIMTSTGNPLILGGSGNPILGGSIDLEIAGMQPGDSAVLWLGTVEQSNPMGSTGTQYTIPRRVIPFAGNTVSHAIPNLAGLEGAQVIAQVVVTDGGNNEVGLSNAVRVRLSATSHSQNEMGYRAGHPTRVLYNAAGTSAIMLNRGSEDLFLYDINGSDMTLRTVFPERIKFAERIPLEIGTPMGDLPTGMDMIPDPTTANDDALLYVINEGNRRVSSFIVDFSVGTIIQRFPGVLSITGADEFNFSERLGQELFEDASRAQTAGNFNNSCASCHFEGGEDGNVWQRGAGPRSTMPVYGGTLGTGLILWKGVRLNMGETGPMFGGENGGHGILTDAEQQGLTDYHEKISPPLNPNRTAGMGLDPIAAFGRDLFFGKNDTGANPFMRTANCFECHDNIETEPNSIPGPRFFTVDFLNPLLTSGDNVATVDPECFSLRESIAAVGVRNVNTGANVDIDGDMIIDIDRNGDGFDDRESYAIMNVDTKDDFKRDDQNGYLCPCDPINDQNCDVNDPFFLFTRPAQIFSIPTKLGVFSTGPYFHDHAVFSLRGLVDPEAQMFDPVYGDVAYSAITPRPTVFKIYNEVHDVRGHEMPPAQPGDSKVQQTLSSTDFDADTEAILRFIQSL